ncbi:hypothetical protein PTTG_09344 [Puccinia triticina 1-1 BBBD Race 1]|uniref:BUB1 N-terminal domain-containing protein n=2 Tax=Puccinia triticina TaxID=208348 RepID=A0A180GL10_PUCT1|nr:uncharacterized protein PtA15_6A144 [Puccinia triticina]OAV93370.1 hypothetical protein PTTG_09344 [Puccinia triticina 1-1 BBBD Race 1]WAQ85516.1 hypothetical protein PtA15_6A144 [Puccinia triticina]WAR55397.1 hypothetical protein PtB15_6B138 [Puccinia triticina]
MEDHAQPVSVSVDIDVIENQKENIQPIKSGRSAAQLVSLFNPAASASTLTHSSNSYNPINLIEQRKLSHEKFQHHIRLLEDAFKSKPISNPQDKLLAEDLLKDPLDIYLQYIRWTIESYPAGGTSGESKLIPLLEQVTRKFLKDERYQQDVRYLKCWIFYANQVNTTIVASDQKGLSSSVIPNNTSSKLVLNYVIHNRIGTKFGLLYLEYFKLFMPIQRLETNEDDRYKLEQVLKFGISQTAEDELNPQLVELLNQIQSIAKDDSRAKDQVTDRPGEGSRKPAKTGPKMINSKAKTKMKIFEDFEGHAGTSQADQTGSEAVESLVEPPFSLVSKWDSLGTVHSNRKQNTLNPSTWKGQKLPMKLSKPSAASSSNTLSDPSPIIATSLDRPPAASTRSKIKVYEDHFLDNEQQPSNQQKQSLLHESDQPSTSTGTNNLNDDHGDKELINPHLLDDLLTSEIESQAHAIHNQVSGNHDQPRVLKFDPLQFLS